ncbi:transcriptional repressor scratch 1 [Ceratitis capitata]|uniref:(Mediterranean fruit fly) hypothetical protein n=1 Tax=Ceratitis capitata TaxID=7213 RepID=W8AYB5_CERCA|nr:transcriptional repressor scratch 1 [Ceratitis capitata]CAD7014691.1 unnamed protein product [Ceratitis capitata]
MNLVSIAIQRAALQSIAATPSTHLSSLMNFPHPHTPTQPAGAHRSISPTRRYSISASNPTVGNAAGIGAGGGVASNRPISPLSGNLNTVAITTCSSSSAASGPSTSAAAAAAASNSALITPGGGSCSDEAQGISNSGNAGGGGSHIAAIASGSAGTFGGAYTCERCGNSYARPHSLNRHMRFECGVEPKFECPICHKKSKHKHNLVLHMRTHQHR